MRTQRRGEVGDGGGEVRGSEVSLNVERVDGPSPAPWRDCASLSLELGPTVAGGPLRRALG